MPAARPQIIISHARLCNKGYAFGFWLSLSVRHFWAVCAIKAILRAHVAPERYFSLKNWAVELDDCSNHAEAIKTTLSSSCGRSA